MARRLTFVGVLVNDLDAAIAWYRDMLGFEVRMDSPFEVEGNSMRWVTMGLPDDGVAISLMVPMAMPDRPADEAGNGPMIIIEVEDCKALTQELADKGVEVVMPVNNEPFGTSSVIRDLAGNPYNLVTPHVGHES